MKRLPADLEATIRRLRRDVVQFAEKAGGVKLRRYQAGVARAVADSVVRQQGLSFVVLFPRQSGKNELQAQLEAFLLARFASAGGEMVKVSPTWKPQNLNAMARLERALSQNLLTSKRWQKEWGYIYRVGKAKITFLSGAKTANIVGATASLLLEVDEAQDVDIDKYDKEIAPMAAAHNATRVLWGTAWTDDTLLAREMGLLGGRGNRPGAKGEVFVLTADEVRLEAPAYGEFVDEQVRRLGRHHPMVRSQYFSETVAAAAGLFPEGRRGLMQGSHPALAGPQPGEAYALLLDVGGSAPEGLSEAVPSGAPKAGRGNEPEHDLTALTVVRVRTGPGEGGGGSGELAGEGEAGEGPTEGLAAGQRYEVVHRYAWEGASQVRLYEEVRALMVHWQAVRLVVDATGLGAGLASFLERAFPGQVTGFRFTQQSKSQLGWDFVAIIETGRYKEYALARSASGGPASPDDGGGLWELQALFWQQAAACEGKILPGASKTLQWGVPEGRRDPTSGRKVHDDLLVSAALCARLEGEDWGRGLSALIAAADPLAGMREAW